MNPRTPSDVLAHYAHSLQIAAPKEWEAFVQTFDAYATEVTVAVTNAEQHEILVCQGRAKAFLYLLSLFRDCAKWQQRQQTNPPHPTQQP